MKYVAFLLSALIFFTSASPCCGDEAECIESIILPENYNDHENPEQPDSLPCAPFFSCGNCVGFIFQSFDKVIPERFDFDKQISFVHIVSCENSGFTSSIEKPPQRQI